MLKPATIWIKAWTCLLTYNRINSQSNVRNETQSKTTTNTSPPETLYQQLAGRHEEGDQYKYKVSRPRPSIPAQAKRSHLCTNPTHIHWQLGVLQQKVSSFGGECGIVKSHITINHKVVYMYMDSKSYIGPSALKQT